MQKGQIIIQNENYSLENFSSLYKQQSQLSYEFKFRVNEKQQNICHDMKNRCLLLHVIYLFRIIFSFLKFRFNCYNKNITKMDKQNIPSLPSPLREKHYNFRTAYSRQEMKLHKHDDILMAIQDQINLNASCDLFDVILTDPLLKQLNSSLEKEAQQKKKNKLLESFPHRYRNLVQTQNLYKKLQQNLKEVQKESLEVKELQQSQKQHLKQEIQQLKTRLKEKDQQMNDIKNGFQNEKNMISASFQEVLSNKDKEISNKMEQTNEVQRKFIKIKCQKENLIQYLEQMKEEGQTLKRQNERIIKMTTQHQLEINRLQSVITENQELYKSSRQKFVQQLTKSQLECKQKIDFINEELNKCLLLNEKLQSKLRQCQNDLCNLLNQRQRQQVSRHQQIQEVRTKLLESIRQKNVIQTQLEASKEENNRIISTLQQKIQELNKQLVNKNIQMQERTLNNELQMHKLRQTNKKITESKDQTIDQMRQNVNLLIQERLFIQGKLLKVQAEKQSLINQIQRMKNDIDAKQRKILQMSFESKKVQGKNIDIQLITKQFKEQINKFMEIINQKEQKIHQYRKNIMNLRSKVNQALSEKDSISQQLQIYVNNNSILINQVDKLRTQLSNCNIKQNVLQEQIIGFSKIINKRKEQKSTQFEIIQGINDQQLVKLNQLQKKLDKAQQKYENILEQLQQYKKQFKEELLQKEKTINLLKKDNQNMKDLIGSKINQNTDISLLINTKIEQLKSFYERKMNEQDKRYRTTIDVLKKEVIELYKQIDLKKSMQEEMFNQIMKINKSRKMKKSQIIQL